MSDTAKFSLVFLEHEILIVDEEGLGELRRHPRDWGPIGRIVPLAPPHLTAGQQESLERLIESDESRLIQSAVESMLNLTRGQG